VAVVKPSYIGESLGKPRQYRGKIPLKTKWSYLAGLFDGEGNVTINSYERESDGCCYLQHELQLSITNTDPRLMKWLVKNFGGVYYTQQPQNSDWKVAYKWRPKGAKNKEVFLLGILPYLVIKTAIVKLALEYLRLDGKNAVDARKELAAEARKLNHRGKSVETNTLGAKAMIESDLTSDCESELAVMQVS
jgi:hypothetical protein